MTEAVHEVGGVIVVQLAHAGCRARPEVTGSQPIGPSPLPKQLGISCREMGAGDIEKIVSSFAEAAVRARKAGFDGVQLHAAHGYLLSQFLSRFFNKRKDDYGMGQRGRSRLLLEIVRRIKMEAGGDYPLLIKMNSEDFLEDGLTINQMLETAAMLEVEGATAIELSGGTPYSGKLNPLRQGKFDAPEKEVFYRQAAGMYKSKIGLPLLLVGGIRSFGMADNLIEEGITDFIGFSRPLICEPGLIARWKAGDQKPSICVSDNLCIKSLREGSELRCLTFSRLNV